MAIFITLLQFFAMIFGFIYSIIRVKKLTPITFEVRRGERCYSCSGELEYDELDYTDFDRYKASLEREDFKLCVSCKREENLDQFIKTGFPDATRINKLKKFLFSKKSDKLVWYFLFAIFTGVLVEFVARFVFDIKMFWLLSPIFNIVYWSLFCYKSKITYIKE
jgi:hypothetical protein